MRKFMMAIVCGLCLIVSAQTRPSTQSGATGFADMSVSEPRIQDLQGLDFLHLQTRMSIRQMHTQVHAEVMKMEAAMKDHGIMAHGSLLMIMHGMTGNPDQPFDIQMGFPVDAGVTAPAGYETAHIPGNKLATVIYSGPIAQVGMAYQKLYSVIIGAGLTPTAESRMYYLYWEGEDSVNNVLMIAAEVQ